VPSEHCVGAGGVIVEHFVSSQDVPEGQAQLFVASQTFPPEHFVLSGLHHQPVPPEQVGTPQVPQEGLGES